MTQDDARALYRLGKSLVTVLHRGELSPQVAVVKLQSCCKARWRQPVRLGEDHIEANDSRAAFSELVDNPGDQGARPWPLANGGQTFFIDIHDRHRISSRSARICSLV